MLVHYNQEDGGRYLYLDDDLRDGQGPWVVGGLAEDQVRQGLVVWQVLVDDCQGGKIQEEAEGHQEERHQGLLKLDGVVLVCTMIQALNSGACSLF